MDQPTRTEYPNREEFDYLCEAHYKDLSLDDIGNVFGPEFYKLIIYLLVDANEAGRAIQNAFNRLSKVQEEAEEEDE